MVQLCVRMASSCNPCSHQPIETLFLIAGVQYLPVVFPRWSCHSPCRFYWQTPKDSLPSIAISPFSLDLRSVIGTSTPLPPTNQQARRGKCPFAHHRSNRRPRSKHQFFQNSFSNMNANYPGHPHPLRHIMIGSKNGGNQWGDRAIRTDVEFIAVRNPSKSVQCRFR